MSISFEAFLHFFLRRSFSESMIILSICIRLSYVSSKATYRSFYILFFYPMFLNAFMSPCKVALSIF